MKSTVDDKKQTETHPGGLRKPARKRGFRFDPDFYVQNGEQLMAGEVPDSYLKVVEAVRAHFKPRDTYEQLVALRIADAQWRLGRTTPLLAAAVNHQMTEDRRSVEKEHPGLIPPDRLWLGWRGAAMHAAFSAIGRDSSRALQLLKASRAELDLLKKRK